MHQLSCATVDQDVLYMTVSQTKHVAHCKYIANTYIMQPLLADNVQYNGIRTFCLFAVSSLAINKLRKTAKTDGKDDFVMCGRNIQRAKRW